MSDHRNRHPTEASAGPGPVHMAHVQGTALHGPAGYREAPIEGRDELAWARPTGDVTESVSTD